MLICGFKQSIALTRKTISKSHHYAIRNVRRAIRTEMANKRGPVNWYQPDFHMLEKSQTKRNFYCFPIKKDIRPFSAESSHICNLRFILDQLYPTHVRGGTCYLAVYLSGHISSA